MVCYASMRVVAGRSVGVGGVKYEDVKSDPFLGWSHDGDPSFSPLTLNASAPQVNWWPIWWVVDVGMPAGVVSKLQVAGALSGVAPVVVFSNTNPTTGPLRPQTTLAPTKISHSSTVSPLYPVSTG